MVVTYPLAISALGYLLWCYAPHPRVSKVGFVLFCCGVMVLTMGAAQEVLRF